MSITNEMPAGGHEEIYRLIPHRPPFLFIDEIVSVGDGGVTARLKAREGAPFFEGHYPGNPIMPGVLLCEAVFQAGAVLLVKQFAGEIGSRTPVLTRIREARFKNIVRPGDILTINASLTETMGQFHFLRGSISCENRRILTIDFSLALIEEKK